MSITHIGKGADCNTILVPTSAGRNATQAFCKCPHGFVGNPYNECNPKIVACEKCGMYCFLLILSTVTINVNTNI